MVHIKISMATIKNTVTYATLLVQTGGGGNYDLRQRKMVGSG
jgi:hypothetical protein